MSTTTIEQQLETIQQQLATVQAELAERNRRLAEFEELRDDLALVANDVTRAAIDELDDLTPFVRTGDFLALLKRLLRNTHRISDAVQSLDSAASLVEDAQPMFHDWFNQVIMRLDEMERQGYFQAAREARDLAGVLVDIAEKHQLLPALKHAAAATAQADPKQLENYSMWRLYREFRRPEVRRALGAMLVFLQSLGEYPSADPNRTTTDN